MNETMQRGLWLAFGILIVLFLLLDGGALAGAIFAGDGTSSSAHWVWVAPTLLIFGMGFVLGWLVFGSGALNSGERRSANRLNEARSFPQTDASNLAQGDFSSSRR